MARVLGLGGVFFKAKDPKALGEWYSTYLGLKVDHPYGATLQLEEQPPGAYNVWTPFASDTSYFEPSSKDFMFNLVVDDVDGVLARAVEGGATPAGEIEEHEFGRFGWFIDPEGNKVELWKPPKATE